jgi:hypothetical protein
VVNSNKCKGGDFSKRFKKLKQWLDLVSLNLQSCFVFSGGFTAGR